MKTLYCLYKLTAIPKLFQNKEIILKILGLLLGSEWPIRAVLLWYIL